MIPEPNIKRWNMLEKELKVATTIQKFNECGKVPHFTSILNYINTFDADFSRIQLHNALDNLIDLGTIDAEWTKVGTNWVRKFFIDGYSKNFIKKVTFELF
jgi:hypothetical protein